MLACSIRCFEHLVVSNRSGLFVICAALPHHCGRPEDNFIGHHRPIFLNQAKAMFPDVHVKEGLHPGRGHATRAT